MRSIAIIGAGQAGLLLGIGLLDRGYRVTLVSDRTPDEILNGPAPAGAVIFHDAREVERKLGLALWENVATEARAVHIDIAGLNGQPDLSIEARLDCPGQCVDQRLKSASWIEIFLRRGGHFLVKPTTVSDLEVHARANDLVVIATGKGALSRLFPRDDLRSPPPETHRRVSMVVVKDIPAWDNFKNPGVKFCLLPGVGEIFSAPMYMRNHVQSYFIGFEAIPGGPMDRVVSGMSPQAQLAVAKELFRELVPWDYAAIRNAVPGDPYAYLFGSIIPTVRRPWSALPSGALVMGIADAVNLHDPIAAQGANNAAKMASLVRDRIVLHGDAPLDQAWMESVFDQAWAYLQHSNALCHKLLLPQAPYANDILGAAAQNPIIASRLINGFNHPPSLFPWFFDPVEAQHFLASTRVA